MPRHNRLLLTLLVLAALLWLLLAAAERALALVQRFLALPPTWQWLLGGLLTLFAAAGAWLVWLLLRPRHRRRPAPAADRATLEARIARLDAQQASTLALHAELTELDRRRAGGVLHVALFGAIASGKSTLVRALVPGADPVSEAIGGSTREVRHYHATLAGGRPLLLADMPGSHEAGGEEREALARAEALRCHAVVYLCAGDLDRSQVAELRWLADFGKPLVLALNKRDQWRAAELDQLLERLRERAAGVADAVVAISAGGTLRLGRPGADAPDAQVERERPPEIAPLLAALERLTAPGAAGLEAARERAVLAGLDQRTGALETATRAAEAERIVRRYAQRAIVGALAAVAPGSDLVIQGALAAGLVRALAQLHGVPVKEMEIADFIAQARLTLRTGSSIVLAIAGNALKAFPGLGTLGGGVLHAFAYALIFDALGRALAASLATRQRLDQADAAARLKELLLKPEAARLQAAAQLTLTAAGGSGKNTADA